MRLLRTMLLLSLAVAASCYTWVPHEGARPPAGTDVRVRVTDDGGDELRTIYGPHEGSVAGPLTSWDAENVGILVRTTVQRPGFTATTLTDTIQVPTRLVSGIDVKELDRSRTAWFTAGVVAGSVGLVLASRALSGGDEPNEGGGPPIDEAPIIRIPIHRIPIRIGGW